MNPIGQVKERFNKLSTPQKVAAVAVPVATAALCGVAYAKGKNTDAFITAANNAKAGEEGAKKLGVFKTMKEGFGVIGGNIKGLFAKKAGEAAEKVEDVAANAGKAEAPASAGQKVEGALEDAAEAVKNAADEAGK